MDCRLQHPFTCMIVGMTGCGKSWLVRKILNQMEDCIHPKPERIIWCYSQYQPLYDEVREQVDNIEFIRGLPTDIEDDSFLDVNQRNLIILDDLMTSCGKDQRITRLFTVGSHHRNTSILYLLHNLFDHGSEGRNISLNSHYIVLFKNPRDKMQVQVLSRQMYPGQGQFLLDAYDDCTARDHGYLLIDLKPNTPEDFRLRSGICPEDMNYSYVMTPSTKK